MKKLFFIIAMLGIFGVGRGQNSGYCEAGSNGFSGWEYIAGVFCGNIQINSGLTPGSHYHYYENISTNMVVGNSYPIAVVNGYPYFADICMVWIDWNQDLDFGDPGEAIIFPQTPGMGPYETSITPPADAHNGMTRMRVRIFDGSVNVADPCGFTSWGEVEDYNLIVYNPGYTAIASFIDTTACSGQIALPLVVSGMSGVTSFYFKMNLPAGVTYTGITSTDSLLLQNLSANQSGNLLLVNCSAISPMLAQTDTLLSFHFSAGAGTYSIAFDTTNAQSYFMMDGFGMVHTVFGSANIQVSNCGQISGVVRYDNTQQSPLFDVAGVILTDNQGNSSNSYTNFSGQYVFPGLADGTYTLDVYANKAWGGGNALDGLIIIKYFTGLSSLSGIRLKAADTNGDGTPNSLDALLVLKRFSGMISTFPAGDWVFEQKTVTITGGTAVTADLKGICVGDVNGSNVP
jgi:hypothetical protein